MQIARPISDVTLVGAWVFTGGFTTAWQSTNATQSDLGTHNAATPAAAGNYSARLGLTALSKPATTSNHVIRTQCRASSATSGVTHQVILVEDVGGVRTVRWTSATTPNINATQYQEYSFLVPTANVAAIVDYTKLSVEVNLSCAGVSRGQCTWVLFVCPDVQGVRRGRVTEDFTGQTALSGNWRTYIGAAGNLATASYSVGANCLQLTVAALAVLFEYMAFDFPADSFTEMTLDSGFDNTKVKGGPFIRRNRDAIDSSVDTWRYNVVSNLASSWWEAVNDGRPLTDIRATVAYAVTPNMVASDVVRSEAIGSTIKGKKNGTQFVSVLDTGDGTGSNYLPITGAGNSGVAIGTQAATVSPWKGPTKIVMGSIPNFLPAPVDSAGIQFVGVGFGASY